MSMATDSSSENTSFLPLVEACANFPYDIPPEKFPYYQLFLPNDPSPHGYLLPETVHKMPWTSRFEVSHEKAHRSVTVTADPSLKSNSDVADAINTAFAEVINTCVEENLFHVLDGQHSEPFAILGASYGNGTVRLERFAAPLFGTTQRGSLLIAYTREIVDGRREMKLWIPRRAAHLYTSPGKLDATVGGGIKAGSTPLETVLVEADEEASLPADLVRSRLRPAGCLTYISVTGPEFPGEKGLVIPDIIYAYDVELPADIVPRPHDDEVKEFYHMSVPEVRERLLNGEFKPVAALILVDFFVRHGIITAENERNYVEINVHLHRRLPFRTSPTAR